MLRGACSDPDLAGSGDIEWRSWASFLRNAIAHGCRMVGLVRPDAGEIYVRGEQVRLRSVVDAAHHGIGPVFQERSLVPNLTAAENIVLGSEGVGVRGGVYRWDAMRRMAQEQLDKIGSSIDPLARTDSLSFAERQMVEIAKVLRIEERSRFAPVIILDEPTSVLEPSDACRSSDWSMSSDWSRRMGRCGGCSEGCSA